MLKKHSVSKIVLTFHCLYCFSDLKNSKAFLDPQTFFSHRGSEQFLKQNTISTGYQRINDKNYHNFVTIFKKCIIATRIINKTLKTALKCINEEKTYATLPLKF